MQRLAAVEVVGAAAVSNEMAVVVPRMWGELSMERVLVANAVVVQEQEQGGVVEVVGVQGQVLEAPQVPEEQQGVPRTCGNELGAQEQVARSALGLKLVVGVPQQEPLEGRKAGWKRPLRSFALELRESLKLELWLLAPSWAFLRSPSSSSHPTPSEDEQAVAVFPEALNDRAWPVPTDRYPSNPRLPS